MSLPVDPLLLAIDLGTSSVKVLVVTAAGAVVARGEAGYPIHHPQPGQAEQNPEDWWAATASCRQSRTRQKAERRRA